MGIRHKLLLQVDTYANLLAFGQWFVTGKRLTAMPVINN